MDEAKSLPPEPARLSVHLERADDRVRIVSAQRKWAVAGFLLFWLSGWTIGCVVLLGAVLVQRNLFMFLFAVPFWAAEIFVFCLIGTMIASRETLVLDPSGLSYRWQIWGWPVARRKIPIAEMVGFSSPRYSRTASEDNRAFAPSGCRVMLQTVSQPLSLPGGADQQEQAWLEQLLNETLATIKRYYAPADLDVGKPLASMPSPEQLPAVLELRPPSVTEVPAPSDTTWRYHFDFDALSFGQRGRLSPGGVGMLLFINCFWNGIVSIFVLGLWGVVPGEKLAKGGAEWWMMFLFLLPFEMIGLVIFVGLIAMLLEPVRFSRWTLLRNAITYRSHYLGLGRTRTYEIRELDRLELRKGGTDKDDQEDAEEEKDPTDIAAATGEGEQDQRQAEEPSPVVKAVTKRRDVKQTSISPDAPAETRFELAFVDRAGVDVCTINDVSLGEACWMADVVLRERAGWFKS